MAKVIFERATKKKARLRMAIAGPSGSGKTYTSLIFATALAQGGKVALLDTERGSASKYADKFEFDVIELDSYSPERYIEVIEAAEKAGYAVLVIDSLSHAWEGRGGLLDLHDKIVRRQRTTNTFMAWKDVTPLQRALVDAMLQSNCHIIATMRTKTEWVLEENERHKKVPRRVGLQPIQRKGIEYEFDIVADMDLDQQFAVSKTRCSALRDERRAVVTMPDAAWFETVIEWLSDGSEEPEKMRIHAAKRPYGPLVLKARIVADAAKRSQVLAQPKRSGPLCGWLESLFLEDTKEAKQQQRYTLLRFFFDKDSSKKLTDGEVTALLLWCTDKVDGQFVTNAYAVTEAHMIVEHCRNEKGQQAFAEMAGAAEDENLIEETADVVEVTGQGEIEF